MCTTKLVLPKQKYCIDLNILVCALFTISSGTKPFTSLDITTTKSLGFSTEDDKEFVILLNNVLDNGSIRQLAAVLIQPILRKETESRNSTPQEQSRLLKKYVKKFCYIYERYFNSDTKNIRLKEEINYFAVQSLFLLVGI